MTRKERLTRTLEGKPVDRPPVCFYEINGYSQNPDDPDEYNIYNDPSWRPLLDLAAAKSDRTVLCYPDFRRAESSDTNRSVSTFTDTRGRRHTVEEIQTPKGPLTRHLQRDKDIDTTWETEHLLKTMEDAEAYLSIPDGEQSGELDISGVLRCEEALGETGIVCIDTSDALDCVWPLFSMADYLVFAMTERELFTEMLERAQRKLLARIRAVSEALPGRLFRIYGPEIASPPYLPPELFREYVVKYDTELIRLIHKSGGYARIHCHGNLSRIMDDIAGMGADATDPIEPPPQGDVSLRYIREKYGKRLVLFGNIELSDIENLETPAFTETVKRTLEEGMSGEGRGFVLMPSASPIGRKLSARTMRHYEIMAELAEKAVY
ncbi:MAG: hypothetical protein FWF44_02280 [Defluviitaleaceae bacterium]|nr:hypothetical protein [Defluviitaleaceae bacterium]